MTGTETLDLAAIRAREAAATEGPWTHREIRSDGGRIREHYVEAGDRIIAADLRGVSAEFIAHARQDVPALLALVDRLTGERDALNAALEHTRIERDEARAEAETLRGQLDDLPTARAEAMDCLHGEERPAVDQHGRDCSAARFAGPLGLVRALVTEVKRQRAANAATMRIEYDTISALIEALGLDPTVAYRCVPGCDEIEPTTLHYVWHLARDRQSLTQLRERADEEIQDAKHGEWFAGETDDARALAVEQRRRGIWQTVLSMLQHSVGTAAVAS